IPNTQDPLYQLQLLRLHRADSHALHLAIGGFEDFKAKAVVLHHLAFAGNSPGEFADQASDGGRLFSFRLAAEEFVEAVHVHSARDDERALAFTHNLRLVVIVADLSHDLFHQVLDGNQTRHAAVFVHHNRHADVLLLHFAQQIASQLALRHEIDVAPHDRLHDADPRFAVGHLQHVLRVDDPLDVVNVALIFGHPGVVLGSQQFDEVFDRGIRRHSKHLGTRLHGLAHRLAAELHHRLDQIAVALLDNALLLASFNQCVHRLGRGLRLLGGVLPGQRSYRLQEAEHDRHRHHRVDQYLQNQRPVNQPFPLGAREEHEGEEAIKHDDDENQADRCLQDLIDAPRWVAENEEPNEQGDGRHGELGEHGHRQRSSRARDTEFRFNLLLEDVDVVLKFAG